MILITISLSGLKEMIAGPTSSNQCFDNTGLRYGQRKGIFNKSLGIADLGTREPQSFQLCGRCN